MMSVFPRVRAEMAACSSASFSGSTLAVASSKITMGASFSMARAMEMRCFSPPESEPPPSPKTVSYPSGSAMIKSWQQAALAAATTCSWVASGRPNLMLFSTVSLKRYTDWNTMEIFFIRLSSLYSRTS